MQVSIELSVYPLAQVQYKDLVWKFIASLKNTEGLKVTSNGMSTLVFGEYDFTVSHVMKQIKAFHEQVESAVFIIKLIAADRDREY